jgi:hypothetical protein
MSMPVENEFVISDLPRDMSTACFMASGTVWRSGAVWLKLAQLK